MALKPKITQAELDALPADIQKEYKPVQGSDDSFMLDVTPQGGYALENVAPIKSALETERRRANRLDSLLKPYAIESDDGGEPTYLDADAARTAMETVAKGDGDVQTRVAAQVKAETDRLTKAHKTELDKLTASLTSAESELQRRILTSEGLEGVSSVKGNPKILLPLYHQSARVVTTPEGKRVVEIVDPATGEARPGSGEGGRMTSAEYFAELAADPDLAVAFKGGTSADNNTNPKNPNRGTPAGTVSSRDHHGLSNSIDDIASGKTVVVDD